jgi:hypothetical protein
MAGSRALFDAARAYAIAAMHQLTEKCPPTEPKTIRFFSGSASLLVTVFCRMNS